MPMKIKPSMLRNVGRSLGFATKSAFSDIMPTIRNMTQENKNYIEQIYNETEEKTDPSQIKRTYIYKSGKQLLDNIKEDLKTGNLYNKDRQDNAENSMFSDMGFDNLFDNNTITNNSSEEDQENSNIDNSNTNNINNIINVKDDSNITTGLGKLSNLSSTALQLNHIQGSTISRQISTMLEFQNKNTTSFYADMSSKLADIASNVAQSTGFLGIMSETSIGGNKNDNSSSFLQDLLGMNGISIEGYKNIYQKKFGLGGGGLSSGFEMLIKPMIDKFVANPIGTAMGEGIKALIPKMFKNALGDFDELMGYLPTMIQGRLQGWKDSDNPLKKMLGDQLALDLKPKSELDFSNYEKGKVHFDGITRRSIVNVIPSLLSKILASVSDDPSHQEELVYDYQNGKFTTKKRAMEAIDDEARKFSVDNLNLDSHREDIKQQNAENFENAEELESFMDRINDVFMKMAENATVLHENISVEDLNPEDVEASQAIINSFREKDTLGKARFQKDVLDSSSEYYRVRNKVVEDESFHNLLDEAFQENIFKKDEKSDKDKEKEYKEMLEKAKSQMGEDSRARKFVDKALDLMSDERKEGKELGRNNPFNWATKGVNKVNSSLGKFFFGEQEPIPLEESKITPKQDRENENSSSEGNSSQAQPRGIFGSIFDNMSSKDSIDKLKNDTFNPSLGNMINNMEDQRSIKDISFTIRGILDELRSEKGFRQDLKTINESILAQNKIILNKNSNESTSESSSNALNISRNIEDSISLIPNINDNIIHIIALLESKFRTDGQSMERVGRLRNSLDLYRGKINGFLDRFIRRTETRNKNKKKDGVLGTAKDKAVGLFDSIFEKKRSQKENKNDNSNKEKDSNRGEGLFSKIFGMFEDRGNKQTLAERMIGKKGILTNFLSNTFSTINDVIKTNAPKMKNFLFESSKSLFNFAKNTLNNVFSFFKNGVSSDKGLFSSMKEKLQKEEKDEKENKSMMQKVFGTLGEMKDSTTSMIGGLLGGGKDKEEQSGTKRSGFQFSIPGMFEKLFNPKNETLHVFVEGGFLDEIKGVVTTKEHISDGNSAKEQFEEFKRKQQEAKLKHGKFGKDDEESLSDILDGFMEEDGGLFDNGLMGAIAAEIAGEVIGNKIGNRRNRRNRRGRNSNTRMGRRGGKRGLFGRLGSAGKNAIGGLGKGARTAGGMATRLGGTLLGANTLRQMGNPFGSRTANNPLPNNTNTRSARNNVPSSTSGGKKGGFLKNTLGAVGNVGKSVLGGLGKVGSGIMKGGGKLLKGAGKLGRFIPGVGTALSAGMGLFDGISGYRNADQVFDTDKATFGQKTASGLGGLLSGLSFGLLDNEKTTKGIYNFFGGKDDSEKDFSNRQGSYADGGVIDYTGKANVHGSKAQPEMVLNAKQSTGLFNYIKNLNEDKEKEKRLQARERKRGEYSDDPTVRTSHWVEQLSRFMTKGPAGMFFGGVLGALTGKTSGIFSSVADKFKGFFGKIFGGGNDGGDGGSLDGPADYSGNSNEQKVWNFFKSKGFSDHATAGILANLKQESGVDPTKKQYGGGPGRGLMQWEKGGRWDQLVSWANKKGKDPMAIETQLDYMWLEMSEKETTGINILNKNYGGMSGLKNADDARWATKAFEDSFERAGKPNYENRYKYADEYLNTFKGTNGSGGDPSGTGNNAVVNTARQYIGKLAYSMEQGKRTNIDGGTGDCSGFTQQVFKKNGISLGNTTSEQVRQGTQVDKKNVQPGDLVFFQGTYRSGVSHVGIAIGGGKMIHLSSSGCREDSYETNSYWKSHFMTIRRIKGASGGGSGSSNNSSGSDSGSSSATPKSSINIDQEAQNNRGSWFTNIWGNITDKIGNALGISKGDSNYVGGPSSNYNGVSGLQLIGSTSRKAMGNGSAYVGNLGASGNGNRILGDSRWNLSNAQISRANNAYNNTVSRLKNINQNYTGGISTLSNMNAVLPSLASGDISTVANKTINEMIKSNNDVTEMQSLMRLINETSAEGNETLREMLSIMKDIREQNKETSNRNTYNIPVPQNARTNNEGNNISFSSPNNYSNEFQSLVQGY